VFGLLTDYDVPLFGHESDNQADFFLLSACVIPGYPYAVRMAQLRLAVMRGKLVFGEDEFSVGFHIA
jgi:hypothetical protein